MLPSGEVLEDVGAEVYAQRAGELFEDDRRAVALRLRVEALVEPRSANTVRAVERIATGLRWRAVQPALVCRGPFDEAFVNQCRELGQAMAVGLVEGMI